MLDVIKDVNRLLSIKFCLKLYNFFRELLKDNRLHHRLHFLKISLIFKHLSPPR